jgi:hypothetical protein
MTSIELLAPDLSDGAPMPRVLSYLLACFTRFHRDPQFVQEQITWLEKQDWT